MKPTKDSLVLYKQAPALVAEAGEKFELVLPGGKTRSVRDKDVTLLHPGPLRTLAGLDAEDPDASGEGSGGGSLEDAWELLQGESPSLRELAELVYGAYSPATSWRAFKLLNRTPWFRGTPEAIEVVGPEEARGRLEAEREKKEAERRWEDFLARLASGGADREADEPFLRDLEMFALGRSKGSRILKALGKAQTPENAHRTMIALGVVDEAWNPWPLRLDLPLDVPSFALPGLPDEAREDFTGEEAFAIDDEGNLDPDDAIGWNGEWLRVHVADAAALVPAGSPQDEAARERASTLYLPERIVPMLPPEAAERLGLGLADTSPAMTYSFRIGPGGAVEEFRICLSTVRVTRLTYEEADARMDREPFASLRAVTDAFRARREAAGASSISLPEVKIRVRDGEPVIEPLPDLASRRMVTEAMLMAGFHAAAWCRERGLAVPYASQQPGDAPADPQAPPAPDDLAAHYAARRGMKRSRTSLEAEPHAGLGLALYSRVTSPLRRYPDLLASRQIRALVTGREPEDEDAVLRGLAAFESRAGSLVQGERKSNLHWKMVWLEKRPDWTGEAVLVDRRERQGFFLIPGIALETRAALKKDVPLGGRVAMVLKSVDVADCSAVFVPGEAS